jgi:hypothetical protein
VVRRRVVYKNVLGRDVLLVLGHLLVEARDLEEPRRVAEVLVGREGVAAPSEVLAEHLLPHGLAP